MAWVVDTCVVIDVLENDPMFGVGSAKKLQSLLDQGLVLCPVSMVELSPAFAGDLTAQKSFLDMCGISYHEPFTLADSETAHVAWNAYIQAKRSKQVAKRPVADLLIGGFALRFDGLVTRNRSDFQRWFRGLKIVEP
ncbi:type II toxin-antitoxin system VapC family toxin [Puniceicoccus vermicola]|uniref:Type II toxin-antitoxin system VapC family toxin n=1 Tax=Puniceicoccus vermicola TaxID=388746 RepID=A0A7X1E4X2_9BACT|nr:type II toxin-antitoxin system VapC family toxin [Puniceicoccus vermicola]MBC2602571.1 type II toxin-antitoxin system VapC family toxin [Puniceicoccus vermicola]